MQIFHILVALFFHGRFSRGQLPCQELHCVFTGKTLTRAWNDGQYGKLYIARFIYASRPSHRHARGCSGYGANSTRRK